MTVKELYENIGADYQDALTRLMNDKILTRFILKFPKDDSFENLCVAWEEKNLEQIFTSSHTLKGVCANLSIVGLFQQASEICEAFRNDGSVEKIEQYQNQMDLLKESYQHIVDSIYSFEKAL